MFRYPVPLVFLINCLGKTVCADRFPTSLTSTWLLTKRFLIPLRLSVLLGLVLPLVFLLRSDTFWVDVVSYQLYFDFSIIRFCFRSIYILRFLDLLRRLLPHVFIVPSFLSFVIISMSSSNAGCLITSVWQVLSWNLGGMSATPLTPFRVM